MALSRLSRYEERQQQKRLALSIVGIVSIVLFVSVFGIKLLVNFSLLVDRIRGTAPSQQQTQQLILPPVLDPLPQATNSATLTISGSGQSGFTLIVYLNEREAKKLTVPDDGTFKISSLVADDGINTVSAKLIDDKGNTSDLSNVISITVRKNPPSIDVNSPADNSTVSGDTNEITVSGKTQEEATVTINDRFVVVRSDGSFTYSYPLSEGDNTLRIIATDTAGNQAIIERRVKYQK